MASNSKVRPKKGKKEKGVWVTINRGTKPDKAVRAFKKLRKMGVQADISLKDIKASESRQTRIYIAESVSNEARAQIYRIFWGVGYVEL